MAESYIGVNNVAKKISDIYVGVNNVAKKVNTAYIGVNNVAKVIYSPSTPSNPLCFTAVESNSSVLLQSTTSGGSSITLMSFEYKVNNGAWSTYTLGATYVSLPNVGDKMYIRATGTNDFSEVTYAIHLQFSMTGKIAASGSVMSLIEKTGTTTIIPVQYCFTSLFYQCSALTTAPELPATSLMANCYSSMFGYCTNLTTAPTLPATLVPSSAYASMFWHCSSLTTPATLSATNIGDKSFSNMYDNCTALTTTGQIHVTVAGDNAMQYMFFQCTSLTTLPKLNIIDIKKYQYFSMFFGCTNIAIYSASGTGHTTEYRIPESGTATFVDSSLSSMFASTSGDTVYVTANTTYYTSNQVI